MLYLTLTAVFVLLGLFTFIPRFNKAVERFSVGINFFLTLIATLVGVLLAISITNYDEEQKEKQDVIKLLNSAITSVDTCRDYSEVLVTYFDKLPSEGDERNDFYLKNPLPYPDYLDTFLMQNIVSKNLSGEALSDLNGHLINLKRSRNSKPNLYISVLAETQKLLELEIKYQKGELNEAQLEVELDKIATVSAN